MINPTIVNRIITVIAYIFLVAGIAGFIYFFYIYMEDTDLEFYFFLSLITIVLGFALFFIYKRIADLGFNRFISQLSTLNSEPTTYIRGNELEENKASAEDSNSDKK